MWLGLLLIVLFLLNRYVLDALFRYCAGPPCLALHASLSMRCTLRPPSVPRWRGGDTWCDPYCAGPLLACAWPPRGYTCMYAVVIAYRYACIDMHANMHAGMHADMYADMHIGIHMGIHTATRMASQRKP